MEKTQTVVLHCAIFQKEIEALRESGRLNMRTVAIDSMLHLKPRLLEETILASLDSPDLKDSKIVLLFGDCSPNIIDFDSLGKIQRAKGTNCCEILLGFERYRQFQNEGAFFLMSGWVSHWREIFETDLGLTSDIAATIMPDLHKKIVYLDNGVQSIPHAELESISSFMGLPVEVIAIGLDHLEMAIEIAAKGLDQ